MFYKNFKILSLSKVFSCIFFFGFSANSFAAQLSNCDCFDETQLKSVITEGCKFDVQLFQRGMIEELTLSGFVNSNKCKVNIYKLIRDVDPYNNYLYSCEVSDEVIKLDEKGHEACRSLLIKAKEASNICTDGGIVKSDEYCSD